VEKNSPTTSKIGEIRTRATGGIGVCGPDAADGSPEIRRSRGGVRGGVEFSNNLHGCRIGSVRSEGERESSEETPSSGRESDGASYRKGVRT